MDDGVIDLAGYTGVGVQMRCQTDVRSILAVGGGRDADQEGLVAQALDPVRLDTHVEHLANDLVAQDHLALAAGVLCLDIGATLDRSRVETDVLDEALEHRPE